MAAKYSRRPAHHTRPLSPSIIPDLAILPRPLPAAHLPCGQLVSKSSKHNPLVLEDRDYDDIGTMWYKDVIFLDTESGRFVESFGGTHLVQKPLDKGTEAGTIEAAEQRVRLLKDADVAIQKVWADEEAKKWIKEQGEAGFVVAHRQVANASYKRARLHDIGNGNYEVVREVAGGEDKAGKRRDSSLEVKNTDSKWDTIGVIVKSIVVEGDAVKLGDELGVSYWN